jgi:FkbM family methyltransferase
MTLRAYRSGLLPARGYGRLFDLTPAWWWGGRELPVGTGVGEMLLPLRDHGARSLLVFGCYGHEEAETAALRRLLPRLRGVLDLGASFGWYARLAERHLPAGGRVVAVEANPAVVAYLRRNVGEAVTVLHAAVGERAGEQEFYASVTSSLSSTVRRVGTRLVVPAVTVDQLAQLLPAPVDLVKCDVEGGELAALRGSRAVRASQHPPIWLLEVIGAFLSEIGCSLSDVEREFDRCGPVAYYRCVEGGRLVLLPDGLATPGLPSNVVVVPRQREEEVAPLLHPVSG